MTSRGALRPTNRKTSNRRWVAGVILGIAAATAAIVWMLDANPADRIELRRGGAAGAQEGPAGAPGVRVVAVVERAAPATVLPESIPPRVARARERKDESRIPPGILSVRVLDESEMPLAGVIVRLVANRTLAITERTDRGGRADVELPPGRYRIEVEPATLPHAVLAPYAQDLDAPGTWAKGLGPTIVDLKTEERRDVVIHCRPAGIVRGRVVLAGGRPVVGAMVRLQGQRAEYLPSMCFDATTDFAGRFEMRDVYPADYRVQVFLIECDDVAVRSIPSPIPFVFTMKSGGEHVVPDIVVSIGECTIRGRFVDENGVPLEGVVVACYPARLDGGVPNSLPFGHATTDLGGRFEFRALPPERVRIAAPADYHPTMPVLERKAANFLDPIVVDLGGAQLIDVGDVRLDRSRPLIVRGVVLLDPEFVRLTNRSFRDLVLEIGPEPGFVIPADWPRRAPFHLGRIALDPQTGAFECAVETPHPPVVLELRLAKRSVGFERKRVTIDGTLPRVETLILRYP
jgi:hypothetical protein